MLTHARRPRSLGLALIPCSLLLAVSAGCRLHPVSLASMAIGDAINDADVKKRQKDLLGESVTGADEMFGNREETWVDAEDSKRQLITYPVKGDLLNSQNWVVETSDAKVVSLSRVKRNIDGVEDVIKAAALEKKVMGKPPADCQRDAEFKDPISTLKSGESGEMIRVYDIRNWTNSRGARYCVLRFDGDDLCKSIKLLGVSASSEENPVAKDTSTQ